MASWEDIVSGAELAVVKKTRSQHYTIQKFPKALLEEKLEEGWEVHKEFKKSISLKRLKPVGVQFEDEVWSIFASLGFTQMNKSHNFIIDYGPKNSDSSQQIDVFAADEETVLVIECKTSVTCKPNYFKTVITAWGGMKQGLIKEIKKQYPKCKIKFIFATKNCNVTQADANRLRSHGFIHFNESDLKYYRELGKHLGACARFQLLGNLFSGQKIPSINSVVPAIRGKMGGYTYYTFLIEPDKLLKISYVLHRELKNHGVGDLDLVPTYQRLIKKQRLTAIRGFINDGGFFPNSVVINIDTHGKELQFDLSDSRVDDSIGRLGVLHLPQEYRSAYIIDGQHRLYGYADSDYAENNTIPVVAFIELPQKKQLQLFLDINENQKAVQKNLRLTLEDDLYWDSKNYNEQRQALRSRIAQRLGEDKYSPLYQHVLVAESEKSHFCCIAIKFVTDALSASNFFTKYEKNNLIHKSGTFDRGNNDATFQAFYGFIKGCFSFLADALPSEWNKGSRDNGILTINIGIYALIKVINDIVDYLVEHRQIIPTMIDKPEIMVDNVTPYLEPIIGYYKSVTPKEREELKKKRGSGGPSNYWHTLQQVINASYSDFSPTGLSDWVFANKHVYNDETGQKLHEIYQFIHLNARDKLMELYGEQWFIQGLPKAVYDRASKAANDYNYSHATAGDHKEPWDFISLTDCRNIIIKSGNWSESFEQEYTHPSKRKSKAKKSEKTEWLSRLAKLQNENFDTYSVPEEEYIFVNSIYSWLILHQDISS